MLEEISVLDYGIYAEEHLEALRRIRDTGHVPAPLGLAPREVLELAQWVEPRDHRGHVMRAFACACMLRSAAEPASHDKYYKYYVEGQVEILARLLASIFELGREAEEATLRFLAWCVQKATLTDEYRPYAAFAVLVLAVKLRGVQFDEKRLAKLAEWVVAEEARAREALECEALEGG